MVQTFLVCDNIRKNFRFLDYKRLGKQRLESQMIIKIIDGKTKKVEGKRSWENHPAVAMWRGHSEALKDYYNKCVEEWVNRGYENNMEKYEINENNVVYPWWVKWVGVSYTHRCNLLRKNFDFYSKHFKKSEHKDYSKVNYIWPSKLNAEDIKYYQKYLKELPRKDLYLDMKSTQKPKKYFNKKKVGKKVLLQWMKSDRKKNPFTGKKIKLNAATYKKLLTMCKSLKLLN